MSEEGMIKREIQEEDFETKKFELIKKLIKQLPEISKDSTAMVILIASKKNDEVIGVSASIGSPTEQLILLMKIKQDYIPTVAKENIFSLKDKFKHLL